MNSFSHPRAPRVPVNRHAPIAARFPLVHSPAVRKYLQKIGVRKYGSKGVEDYKTRPNLFRETVGDYFSDVEYPAIVQFHFVRDTRKKFDFHNAVQIVADLLVAHGCIADDDMDHFLPVPMWKNGQWYSLDKNNPGVWIDLIKTEAKIWKIA